MNCKTRSEKIAKVNYQEGWCTVKEFGVGVSCRNPNDVFEFIWVWCNVNQFGVNVICRNLNEILIFFKSFARIWGSTFVGI